MIQVVQGKKDRTKGLVSIYAVGSKVPLSTQAHIACTHTHCGITTSTSLLEMVTVFSLFKASPSLTSYSLSWMSEGEEIIISHHTNTRPSTDLESTDKKMLQEWYSLLSQIRCGHKQCGDSRCKLHCWTNITSPIPPNYMWVSSPDLCHLHWLYSVSLHSLM